MAMGLILCWLTFSVFNKMLIPCQLFSSVVRGMVMGLKKEYYFIIYQRKKQKPKNERI